jgi:integrase
MNETFERVTERRGKTDVPVKHLYRRQYQTAGGNWSTIYYAIFTDWKGKRRKFAVGSELGPAKEALALYQARNVKREDFDADKVKPQQGMILSEWLDCYLELVKHMPSAGTKRAQCIPLKRLLGSIPVDEINRVRIMEYKTRRLVEPIMRHGEGIEGTRIQGATVNREISCLINALNLAADQGIGEGAPKVKKERETARERTLTEAEYVAILNVSPRWLQRVLVAANETGIDQGVLLKLTWDCVGAGLIVVKGGRAKTGAKQRVGISPALNEVLGELRAEYRRIPNTERVVFTKGGKRIAKATLRHAFDKAVEGAKIEDFQFRDFRHCARTRWAAAGLPYEIGEIGIGHKLRGVAGRYINLSDDQIREAFKKLFPTFPQGKKNDSDAYQENTASA